MDSRNNKAGNEKSKKGSSPRIVTMDSIRNSQQESERQAYFAGGSEHSGQQILGRGERRSDDPHSHESGEALAAAFRRASSSSSEARTVSFHRGPQSFTGVGHRLGDTESPHADPIPPPVPMQASDPEDPTQIVLTLWENGYNIDDGPLQSYEDPRCAELMANVDRGELPTDLLPFERPGPVHLSVVDKRAQKYKQSVKVFGGKGHKLGSPTPSMSAGQAGTTLNEPSQVASPESSCEDPTRSSGTDQLTSANNSGPESFKNMDSLMILRKRRAKPLNIDDDSAEEVVYEDDEEGGSNGSEEPEFAPEYVPEFMPEYVPDEASADVVFGGQGHVLESADNISQNMPAQCASDSGSLVVGSNTNFSGGSERSTMVKIRLPDGQTVQMTVNANTSISQLRQYIVLCVPSLGNVIFSLHLTYPRREVRDEESVDSAEINNSVLVLRI